MRRPGYGRGVRFAMLSAVLAIATLAHAEVVETYPMISMPLTLGTHRTTDGGAFSWGLRPEVIAARIDHDARGMWSLDGWGIGGYAQLERADADSLFAGGLTLVGYGSSGALALSVGLYHRSDDDRGVQSSVFFGRRGPFDRDLPADLPFGVRVDLQHGQVDSIIVAIAVDTAPLFALIAGIAVAAGAGRD